MMDSETVFARFQDLGFIKTGRPTVALEASQKVVLNRRGNVLLNSGDIEGARRIFQTTGYSDGLTRVGDRYLALGRSLDALRMYWMAPDKVKAGAIIARLALLIQQVMKEEEDN